MSQRSSRRRTLQAGSLALVTGLAGCSGSLLKRGNSITRRGFTLLEFGTEARENAPDVREPPEVSFDPEENRVTVVGSLYVGSGSCSKAALKQVTYHREGDDDELRMKVGSGPKGLWGRIGLGCTGDVSADWYRATVTFSNRVPATVVVTEGEGDSGRTTTAHPPGSN